jgi:hypothetical protein
MLQLKWGNSLSKGRANANTKLLTQQVGDGTAVNIKREELLVSIASNIVSCL